MPSKPPSTWYVSYVENSSTPRSNRLTRTFATEIEAKAFASMRFTAGDATLMAGTINPISPKRVIASVEIADWLSDES